MSNFLILPSVAFGAFATARWMDDKVFTNKEWVIGTCGSILNSSDEEAQRIALNIIKGAAVGFVVGAVATTFPAALLTISPKACVALGAFAGSVVGVIKATAFVNLTAYLESPVKEILDQLQSLVKV